LSEYYSAWKKYENEEIVTTEIYNKYKEQSENYLNKIDELNESK
jgi:hypothetical protein